MYMNQSENNYWNNELLFSDMSISVGASGKIWSKE